MRKIMVRTSVDANAKSDRLFNVPAWDWDCTPPLLMLITRAPPLADAKVIGFSLVLATRGKPVNALASWPKAGSNRKRNCAPPVVRQRKRRSVLARWLAVTPRGSHPAERLTSGARTAAAWFEPVWLMTYCNAPLPPMPTPGASVVMICRLCQAGELVGFAAVASHPLGAKGPESVSRIRPLVLKCGFLPPAASLKT